MNNELRGVKIFSFWIFVFMVMGILIYHSVWEQQKKIAFRNQIRCHKERVQKEKEIILAEWVYTVSARISQTMSEQIVKEAFKTPHPLFYLAIIKVESHFNPLSISSKGAIGLGQIMPVHVQELIAHDIIKTQRDLFDVDKNIQAMNFVFKKEYKKNKYNLRKTMADYLNQDRFKYYSDVMNIYFDLMKKCREVEEFWNLIDINLSEGKNK